MSFDKIQAKFEQARRDWADFGGRFRYIKLCFWDWRYRNKKVPQKGIK
jgi:hypothetical protein